MDDDNLPATKADIASLRTEWQSLQDTLLERLDDRQNKVLQAIDSFVKSNQLRLAGIEVATEGMRKRLAILEERVLDLERKVNFPNHPTQ